MSKLFLIKDLNTGGFMIWPKNRVERYRRETTSMGAAPGISEILEFDDWVQTSNDIKKYIAPLPESKEPEKRKWRHITLCGSTKFKKEFQAINIQLTLEGNVVYSVASFAHADKIEWTKEQKEMLDEVHKRKIDNSEVVFVIDVDGYIGSSTRSEIEYAESKGKSVKYLSDFPDLKMISDYAGLAGAFEQSSQGEGKYANLEKQVVELLSVTGLPNIMSVIRSFKSHQGWWQSSQGEGQDELWEALKELVALKDLKDSQGKTAEYEERQPKAWEQAKKILNAKK